MLEAKELWEQAGLPKIKPVRKWFGYSLGDWCEEWDKCAERAVNGQWLLNRIRTAKLVDTDAVGGPTAGVPKDKAVIYHEDTHLVEYPEGFPCVDDFDIDD